MEMGIANYEGLKKIVDAYDCGLFEGEDGRQIFKIAFGFERGDVESMKAFYDEVSKEKDRQSKSKEDAYNLARLAVVGYRLIRNDIASLLDAKTEMDFNTIQKNCIASIRSIIEITDPLHSYESKDNEYYGTQSNRPAEKCNFEGYFTDSISKLKRHVGLLYDTWKFSQTCCNLSGNLSMYADSLSHVKFDDKASTRYLIELQNYIECDFNCIPDTKINASKPSWRTEEPNLLTKDL